MGNDLINAIELMCRDKGLEKEVLVEAIESALTTAYKKYFESDENIRAFLNMETGEIGIVVRKKTFIESDSFSGHITVDDERSIDHNEDISEESEEIVKAPSQFQRIAAQTAKQILVQKIKEAERDNIYKLNKDKKDQLVTGVIHKIDRNNCIVGIGKTEAVLPLAEQMPGEKYYVSQHLKLYVVDVKDSTKSGPQIVVSRTHPGLIRRLFELEVPEIKTGTVELLNIAREAGSRTKIAVNAVMAGVDPVGSCVGQRGARVQNITNELGNEKIDIVVWSADPAEFISNALSPSKVSKVDINPDEKAAKVVVPDSQLSLAIGKEGQNARLAVKLTGWKIDIKSESQYAQEMANELFNVVEETENTDEQ
ncbi:MAG: transcription termination/antitermination protein NusA [Clostridia bacterium]|nr:transcription termination/antitermination protein NusA [Clostridia bacterium]